MIYINLGYRFEFRTQILSYERISGNFCNFTDFHAKKDNFSILAVIQNIWTYINLGCRFEFRTQKLPYERISGNFSDFIDFGHQVRVCKKRSFPNISYIQNVWDLHKFGIQIWIQNANIIMKEFRAIFAISPFSWDFLNISIQNIGLT